VHKINKSVFAYSVEQGGAQIINIVPPDLGNLSRVGRELLYAQIKDAETTGIIFF
jgi:hypothetical protein